MILQAVLELVFGLIDGLLGLLPTAPPPDWFADGAGYFGQIWAMGTGLGGWVPWDVFGLVLASVGTCLAIAVVVRITRILISVFTGGGGSAA
ncbi:hypothetical protein SAMN04487968_1165 [Nocardioides terrae]|uniref:Uncharacterized protein n=1 Tax=Nocardioides terrae TaxID=574651 RepID=A0A1I1NBN3_9ACTN|nr:hypothetical protein [Nocardioides terrae]SFC94947.1 hypothetical protein SAMN04487968_1165 [Nocardioides terrae]